MEIIGYVIILIVIALFIGVASYKLGYINGRESEYEKRLNRQFAKVKREGYRRNNPNGYRGEIDH